VTVRLRAHHLFCLLTYAGKGYTPAFVANFNVIAGRLNGGEDIEIVSGRDDICAALAGEDEPHCSGDSVTERDRLAAEDLAEVLGTPVRAGVCLGLDTARLSRMRAAFSGGAVRRACAGCEWSGLCGSIAESGYRGARISGQ
jgi:hypothetical protein